MESHYEINVALNGKHFFATAPRSLRDKWQVERVLPVLLERFPAKDGYSVGVTYYECLGYQLETTEFVK
jgi:hypothetical protein